MSKVWIGPTLACAAAALAACGHNVEQRAATGGIVGLAVAGPIGAVQGARAGSAISAVLDRDATKDAKAKKAKSKSSK